MSALADLEKHLEGKLGPALLRSRQAWGELTILVPGAEIVAVLTTLRDDPECLFEVLIDICGVDYPQREKRYDVVYHLLSLRKNQRLRVICETDEDTPVPSVVAVFPAALMSWPRVCRPSHRPAARSRCPPTAIRSRRNETPASAASARRRRV